MLQAVILGGAFLTVVFFCVGFYQMLFASRLTVFERLRSARCLLQPSSRWKLPGRKA